ncbi:putative ATP-binding cassette sub-family D member 3 [Paratrimastix pyriformis]|uniref:ATP-binding cassette sub-family D member 3 n=1 Tax=Paratrimastix pyriformis TaxID=342808 RepID=A0ABQ8UTL4_9EUKA|nr:putative ATP-binding cassette sub-family D member 3 [Paratrimastix pyriformis]
MATTEFDSPTDTSRVKLLDQEERSSGASPPQSPGVKDTLKKHSRFKDALLVMRFLYPSLFSWNIFLTLSSIGLATLLIFIDASLARVTGNIACTVSCSCTETWKSYNLIVFFLVEAAVLCVLHSLIAGALNGLGYQMAANWRRQLTTHLHLRYFRDNAFYQILTFHHEVDNPDQRITADVKNLTAAVCGSNSPPTLGFIFGAQGAVYNLSKGIFFTVLLLLSARQWVYAALPYAWVLFSAIGAAILSRPLARLTYEQDSREGDGGGGATGAGVIHWAGGVMTNAVLILGAGYPRMGRGGSRTCLDPLPFLGRAAGTFRYTHVRVRTYAESIAFYSGEDREAANADATLKGALANQRRLILSIFPLNMFQEMTLFGASLWGFVIGAVAASLDRTCNATNAMTSQIIVDTLTHTFTHPAPLPQIIAGFGGNSSRVADLLRALDAVEAAGAQRAGSAHQSHVDDATTLRADGLTLQTPKGEVLYPSLSFDAARSTAIMGPSGCGKSSLLRVLGGLWPLPAGSTGTIRRPLGVGDGGVLFLPQRSYCPVGSLRAQLVYPASEEDVRKTVSDTCLKELLVLVDLAYLLDRHTLDTVAPWEDLLSGGEARAASLPTSLPPPVLGKRMAALAWLCRIIIIIQSSHYRPLYAIMDEATSALDVHLERRLLSLCVKVGVRLVRAKPIPHYSTSCTAGEMIMSDRDPTTKFPSIGPILSVCHRPTVLPFHEQILRLRPDTHDCALEPIPPQIIAKASLRPEELREQAALMEASRESMSRSECPPDDGLQANDDSDDDLKKGKAITKKSPKVGSTIRGMPQRGLWRVFWMLFRFAVPGLRWWLLVGLCALLGLVSTGVSALFPIIVSNLTCELNCCSAEMQLVGKINVGNVWMWVGFGTILCLVTGAAKALNALTSNWIGLRWRERLVTHLQTQYFRNKLYHRVLSEVPEMDNPDQRLVADTKTFIDLCCGSIAPPIYGAILGPYGLLTAILNMIVICVVAVMQVGWMHLLACFIFFATTAGLNLVTNAALTKVGPDAPAA